jgi:hypothetical protein
MESLYPVLRFLHVMAFVFMSVPLFNLIVVNERAQLGSSFSYDADRYMENIIRRGATRCFAFQGTVLVTGVLLLIVGPLGLTALWSNWVLLVKTLLLFGLMGLLYRRHPGRGTAGCTATGGSAGAGEASQGAPETTCHGLSVPRDRDYHPWDASLRKV